MYNKALIRSYFWGGYVRGGWLISHDLCWRWGLLGFAGKFQWLDKGSEWTYVFLKLTWPLKFRPKTIRTLIWTKHQFSGVNSLLVSGIVYIHIYIYLHSQQHEHKIMVMNPLAEIKYVMWNTSKYVYIRICIYVYIPGYSKWPFDPRSLEVTNNPWKGHVFTIPKGHKELPGIYIYPNNLYSWRVLTPKTKPKLQSKQGSWKGSRYNIMCLKLKDTPKICW